MSRKMNGCPYDRCAVDFVDVVLVFFFQAEDGIRDYKVTGVQTCALPIFAAIALLAACHDGDDVSSPTETTATTTTATAGATSGIEGQVLLGPTCPVEREGVSCEEPYEATIVGWDGARTQRVFTFDSAHAARCHLGLSPSGSYNDPQAVS